MGFDPFDEFSALHFSSGFVSHRLGITAAQHFVLHALFEWIENRPEVIPLIAQIPFWPGGKEEPDSVINSIGDVVSGQIGWWVSAMTQ